MPEKDPAPAELDAAKQALRNEMKRRRAALPADARREEDAQVLARLRELAPLQRARRVFCFISHGDEIDTHALLDELLRQGKEVVVPRITPEGMVAVPFRDWDELRAGQLGILTPVSSAACEDTIDVCITPGLAFTGDGKRLGYGRAYYDRWFAGHPVAHRVAIAYDCQVVDDLPADERDIPVTMLITGCRQIVVDQS